MEDNKLLKETFVFCAIADIDGYNGSVNIGDVKNRLYTFFCNAFVALRTTKDNNPTVNVGIITNANIDQKSRDFFLSKEIVIINVPFDEFVFPAENKWSLAFYKLTSLKWAVNNLDYSTFIQIDCDVVNNGNIIDLVKEAQNAVVMLSGSFSFDHPIRKQFTDAFELLYNERPQLIKWGSGLICASKSLLSLFINCCSEVYDCMKRINFCNDNLLGDEFITSVAAIKSELNIVDGKPYMNVYWTDKFYLVSTDFYFDKMVWLHLPDEKERGMLILFKYYKKHGNFPKQKRLYKYLNLPQTHHPYFNYYMNMLRKKLSKH